jgi:hypothetical protein
MIVPIVAIMSSLITCPLNVMAQGGSSLSWDRPAQVVRQTKPRRKPRPGRHHPHIERVPLLTVQYRVLKQKEDGSSVEVSPYTVFHAGDMLKLAVTANQSGFLYVLHQNEGQNATILFPDSRINDGQNYVTKNQEFALPPSACAAPDPKLCWYKVPPADQKEYFIVVFSRDQITDLPNQVALGGGEISQDVINQYLANAHVSDYKISGRPASARETGPAGQYGLWVTNLNAKDNEEIVLRFSLKKT